MRVRRAINDLSYRAYDRMRHREAFRVASAPQAGASDFSGLRGRKYIVLVTHRKDGSPVPTPIWFGLDDAGRLYVHTEERTAKVRRIRRDPHVKVFASDFRGKPIGPAIEGAARILSPGEESLRAEQALKDNYGVERRVYESVMMRGLPTVYIEVTPAAGAQHAA